MCEMVCHYYRLGTHISGVAPVTRQMRINNSSPFGKTNLETFGNVVFLDPET